MDWRVRGNPLWWRKTTGLGKHTLPGLSCRRFRMRAHFGLGNIKNVDSLIIKWPNGQIQTLKNVAANQTLVVNIKNALESYSWIQPKLYRQCPFKEINDSLNIHLFISKKIM